MGASSGWGPWRSFFAGVFAAANVLVIAIVVLTFALRPIETEPRVGTRCVATRTIKFYRTEARFQSSRQLEAAGVKLHEIERWNDPEIGYVGDHHTFQVVERFSGGMKIAVLRGSEKGAIGWTSERFGYKQVAP